MLAKTALSIPAFHTAANLPYILDEHNRARIFHGSNFVEKQEPWFPSSLLDESHVQILANMGMNTLRLGFMWTGAQPESESFNETYFDTMDQIINLLLKHDITPFLDVHQDVMSSYFCLYDAYPKWAVDLADPPKHAFPWPLPTGEDGSSCPWIYGWSSNYFAEATGAAFQTLYNSDSSFTKAFTAFWQKTAEHYKSFPILGYEIINEPWAGNIYADPLLLTPGHAGSKNLLPFYDRVSAAIGSVDSNHLIFYEPVTWGMIFNGSVLGSGFDHVPGGSDYVDRSVFSFHYYCWWYASTDPTSFERQTCDEVFLPKVFSQVQRDVSQTGGAAMMTEWGQACDYDNENPANATAECNAIMAEADKHLYSWTDWYFGGRLGESNFASLTENAQKIFSRTYAKIVAGRPVTMDYDVTTKEFNLCFRQDNSVTSPISEVFVPFQWHYPNGVNVEVKTPLTVEVMEVDQAKNRVLLRNREAANGDGDRMACVNLTPK